MNRFAASFIALATLAGLAPGAAQGAPLRDGVILDLERGAAYVHSLQGGIDAIDLASGNVRWNSRAAARPLLLSNGDLLAQGAPGPQGLFRLVTLDPARGTARQELVLPLPAGVRARVADGPSSTFRVQASAAAGGGLLVTWSASSGRLLQGMLPRPDEALEGAGANAPAAARTPSAFRQGAWRVDLAARRSEALSAEAAQAADTAVRAAHESARLAPSTSVRQLPSVDGRYLLRSEPNPEGGIARAHRWTVSEAATGPGAGKRTWTLDAPVAMAPFAVSGSQLLYVAQPAAWRETQGGPLVDRPLRLRALDLRTGAELWAVALADTAYRGPFPP